MSGSDGYRWSEPTRSNDNNNDSGGGGLGFDRNSTPMYSLGNEFDNEANHTHANFNNDYGDDEDEDEAPPSPPSHSIDEDGDDDDDADDSIFDVHIGRHHGHHGSKGHANNNDTAKTATAGGVNPNMTFDSYDEFGEDTIHAMMDADLRLSAIPPLSTNIRQTADERMTHSFGTGFTFLEEYNNNNGGHTGNYMNNKEDDSTNEYNTHEMNDMDDMSSEGVASLLRGPLMAAKSSARAKYKDTGTSRLFETNQKTNDDDNSNDNHWNNASPTMGDAGKLIMVSPQDPIGNQHHQHITSMNAMSSTPSAARNAFLVSPRITSARNELVSHTPSDVRSKFVSSPQDSVSATQSLSATSSARSNNNAPPSSGDKSEQSVSKGNMINYRSNEVHRSGNRSNNSTPNSDVSEYPTTSNNTVRKSPISDEANEFIESNKNFVQPTTSNTNSNSLEHMIALGEAQMRNASNVLASNSNNSDSNGYSNNNDATSRTVASTKQSLPPKKSFLRKGARKEPSSLHTVEKYGVQSNHQSAVSTPVLPSSSEQSDMETTTERKARLARLEKMQQDCMKDLEKRQQRKEEAQRERRNAKIKEVGSRGVFTGRKPPSGSSNNSGGASHLDHPTPSQVRTRSVSRGRIDDGGGGDTMTPSQARSMSASTRGKRMDNGSVVEESNMEYPTPSQVRPRSASRGKRMEGSGEKSNMEYPTPSQVRPRSTSRGKRMDGSGEKSNVDYPTPSQVRPRSTSRGKRTSDEEHPTPSQMRPRSDIKEVPAKVASTEAQNVSGITECSELPTPSQVRLGSATKATPSTLYEHRGNDNRDHDITSNDVYIKGKMLSRDNDDMGHEQRDQKPTTKPPRSRSAQRPNGRANQIKKGSLSPKRNAAGNSGGDKEDFEEWKRKEEEQWSLIKNMRKRQEAALREAEGERERAKAWAAAEKESVRKWADEQRVLIRKDRHKAANAALLASKKASKESKKSEEDEENHAMKIKMDELRAEMKKMKADADEAKKLKEQVRRQQKQINELMTANGEGVPSKPPTKSTDGSRRVLSDCTSSKENKRETPTPKTKGKTGKDKSKKIKPQKSPQLQQQRVPDDDEVTTLTVEEPTEHWLQHHLTALSNANNQLDDKIDHGHQAPATVVNHMEQLGYAQRKPYNAADYSGHTNIPPNSSSGQHYSNNTPQLLNPAATPTYPSSGGATSDWQGEKKCQVFTYKNGTQKEVLSDGTTTISFANGDKKRTYTNEKKGIVVYYYAATKTTQITHQNGMETYHFPNKQIENHHTDGRKEITYPDGTKRMVYPDGCCDTTFPDNVRVLEYPDGTQQVTQVY